MAKEHDATIKDSEQIVVVDAKEQQVKTDSDALWQARVKHDAIMAGRTTFNAMRYR